jgi:hypothetical protein
LVAHWNGEQKTDIFGHCAHEGNARFPKSPKVKLV